MPGNKSTVLGERNITFSDASVNTDPIIHEDQEARRRIEALTKEVKRAFNQRTIAPTEATAQFFEKTNELKKVLDAHLQHQFLNHLLDEIFSSLIKHCEPLLPLASGHYKPHGYAPTVPTVIPSHAERHHQTKFSGQGVLEFAHEGSHFLGHSLHFLLHELHISHLLHIAGIGLTFMNGLPFFAGILAGLVKVLETRQEHHLLEKVKAQLGKLQIYEPAHRCVLYKFVLMKTLLSLHLQIIAHSISDDSSDTWHATILLSCLAALTEMPDQFISLEQFGIDWSQRIINQLKTYGAYMPTSVVKHDRKNLQLALNVQSVFEKTGSHQPKLVQSHHKTQNLVASHKHQAPCFEDPFHKNIDRIIESYRYRAADFEWYSKGFCGYTDVKLKDLRFYFNRFRQALDLIKNEMDQLKGNAYYNLQLTLINACLKWHLDHMALALEGTVGIHVLNKFVVETATLRIYPVAEPLAINKDNPEEVWIKEPWFLDRAQVGEFKIETTLPVAHHSTMDSENIALREQNKQLLHERDQFKANSKQSKGEEQAALALAARFNRDLEERDKQIGILRNMLQLQSHHVEQQQPSGNIDMPKSPRSFLSQHGHFAQEEKAAFTEHVAKSSESGLQQ